jgi:hypothetical protein
MSQFFQNASSASGVVDSITGTNGVAVTPTTGNVTVSGVNATTSTVGVASFNSTDFTVNGSGQVSLAGSGTAAIQTINGTGPNSSGNFGLLGTANQVLITGGTNQDTISLIGPYTPTTFAANGILFGNGTSSLQATAAVDNGVLTTNATGVPSTLALTDGQIIIGSSVGAPTAGSISAGAGITITTGHNSISIAVNGAVVGQTITGNTGGAIPPSSGNWNLLGNGVVGSGTSTAGNIWVSGSGSTLTFNSTQAQFMTNYTSVLIGASPYTVLATDYYISAVSSGGAITIKLPNAPTTNRLFIIKDQSGNASADNISVTTVGGSVTIDGQTTYTISSNYASIQLLFNGTSYEVY